MGGGPRWFAGDDPRPLPSYIGEKPDPGRVHRGYRSKAWHQVAGARPATTERSCPPPADEAVILVWEAADRICGKRLKAALPHLAMERHGHLDLDLRVRQRLLSAATLDRLLQPIGHRRPAGSDAGGSRWAAIFRCGPSPIGIRRHQDSWRLTWWSTTAAPCGVP